MFKLPTTGGAKNILGSAMKRLIPKPLRHRVRRKWHRLRFPTINFRSNIFEDRSEKFQNFITQKRGEYKTALILGNGPSLNELTAADYQTFQDKNYLTIGLNRSAYRFVTDIQLWADYPAFRDLYFHRMVTKSSLFIQASGTIPHERKEAAQFWRAHKSLSGWSHTRLFLCRTVLTSAFDLCRRLEIRNLYLVGFEFDSRSYFYNSEIFQSNRPYEILSHQFIDKNLSGYTTHKIVAEMIGYLVRHEKFTIEFSNPSDFIRTLSHSRVRDIKSRLKMAND